MREKSCVCLVPATLTHHASTPAPPPRPRLDLIRAGGTGAGAIRDSARATLLLIFIRRAVHHIAAEGEGPSRVAGRVVHFVGVRAASGELQCVCKIRRAQTGRKSYRERVSLPAASEGGKDVGEAQNFRAPSNPSSLSEVTLPLLASSNWPKPRLSTSDGALFKELSGRLGDVVDAVRLKKKISKPEKGKRKAGAVKADSDKEDSDFPEVLGTL
ncbi:hypothetical protein B0H17DRAFT_1147092 [Mycena rosella]|uniref:Uncharacterized protein n=1 Tax=Mycena rosella TaxID=1033263 RepID=A0AAD7CPU8_MYCRO|nr:hypothetical protein B0H17DRAFT_1147092 [Mycena rosella]